MNVTIRSSTLPAGFCPLTNEQWQTLVSLMSGTVNLIQGPVNKGQTEPAPDQRSFPWQKMNTDGSPDRIYNYWSGVWLAPHPMPPGFIMMAEVAAVDIPTLDGGEAGTVTPISGPMWEEVTELQAKFPLGAGTLPISGHIKDVSAVGNGDAGGLEKVQLTVAEMPSHTHTVDVPDNSSVDSKNSLDNLQGDPNTYLTLTSAPTGGDAAHQNMPPYYTVRFIRRTNRIFYRGT